VSRDGRRSAHDALRSAIQASVRADVGVVTSLGRIVRLSLLDVPALPPTDEPPSLGGGVPIGEVISLERGEEALALVPLGGSVSVALGTAQGVVKRLAPEEAPARDAWEVIALKPGDAVVGAAVAPDDAELVFVSSDAQLLRYSASLVRPQGRSAGGMAGISLAPGARALFFGAVAFDASDAGAAAPVAVTVAGPSGALPGTTPGTAKLTPLQDFPAKGRATGGVRAHKFLRGEDVLLAAWAGAAPARAVSGGGQSVDLPREHGKRDGSGTPLKAPVKGIG
jgi:DNA gyrase subunit A